MEHRQVEDRPATSRRASGDDPARFLRELRQLRDGAGLGPAELAARAHYPYDRIKAAEVGPTLPDLPVLSAYVRGCGGTTEEWEERWRSLTSAPTLPLLDARPAGCSTAASAGARIGSISPADDPGPFGHPGGARPRRRGDGGQHAVRCSAAVPGRSIDDRAASGRPRPVPVPGWGWGRARGCDREIGGRQGGDRQGGGVGDHDDPDRPEFRQRASRAGGPDLGDVRVGRGASGPSILSGPLGEIGSDGQGGSGQAAAARPVVAAGGASAMATAASGPITVGRRSQGLSRTTVVASIAIAICVLVALLAILV